MNLTLRVFPASPLLRVELTGGYSRAEAQETIDPALEVLIHQSSREVRVGLRQGKGNPSTMDRYAFSVALAEKLNKACRWAI
jgi:hypothetical protein